MKRTILLAVMLAATSALVAAQLYRWVDEKGAVEYRDTPPPKGAKKVEERRVTPSTIETSTPSYSMQQATKNFPVTLWAYDCGDPCAKAREHLARRGVPYTTKDPQADLKAFEKLTGGTGVPVLYVGSTRLTGYLESQWDTTLDTAGYPRTAPPLAAKPAAKPPATAAAEQKGEPGAKPAENAAPDATVAAPPPGGAAPKRAGK